MLLIGQVSTADAASGSVRVAFADRDDMVSGELPVITPGGWARGNAMPKPGETVLCAFLDNSRSAGFCLGTYYGDDHPPGTKDQRGVWFEDGSYVYYDRVAKTLNIKAAGGVKIEGDLTVTGAISRGNADGN
ncbi:phage baseplate assembly protein V [Bacillus sp. FJAT-27264]|uniref:phage baseplate assembly protein V n=1 Tax=Paenibacillus sp. (strain DSM 101736 / FJAT-27264) TaxID=1850362 RepID=UPI000A4EE548|nr:phage baseplate assembly protein V [Bacillus sp. FJAT-27264]